MAASDDLAAIVAEVAGSPDAIRAIAANWTKAADTCATQTTAVKNAASGAGGRWTGAAEQEFQFAVAQFVAASTKEQQCLHNAAKALGQAAQALQEAQTGIQAICNRLRDDIDLISQPGAGASTESYNAAVSKLTADAVASARPVAAGANKTFAQVAGTLSTIASRMKQPLAFSALYVPTTKGFTPPISAAGFGTIPAASGQMNEWISEAVDVLTEYGTPSSAINPQDIWTIIYHESTGNPAAVNNWDINAQEGHPSEGLMQVIQPTFDQFKLPGHDDLTNPVDNIIAGVRYALATYGSLDKVPGVAALKGGGAYQGY